MTRVRVNNFSISLDGYGAGPRQTREQPLGGYACTEHVPTAGATHVVLSRRAEGGAVA